MNNYKCKKFCGNSVDFLCQDCLLKELPTQRLLQELINRNLMLIQKDKDTGRTSSYFIRKEDLKKEN